MTTLILRRPDDYHLHLRDGVYLKRTVSDAARQFERAVVMPNLDPPICTLSHLDTYRKSIEQHIPEGMTFTPLMTLYLKQDTSPSLIQAACESTSVVAFKLYFSGTTTHAQYGVKDWEALFPAFEALQEYDMPLLVHGEVADPNIDVFDREAYFVEYYLQNLLERFSSLRVVFEHITTKEAVDFVQAGPKTLAATVTAHHLWCHRNHLLAGGLRPHYYCAPILKRVEDQQALIKAVTSGHPRFFLGTDSAPHAQHQKESACGCAGVYTAHAALPLYAEIFDQANALDQLENFSSVFGAQFYRLPLNAGHIVLSQKDWTVPENLDFGDEKLIPFGAGRTLHWSLK